LFRVEVRINTTRNILTYFQVQLDATVTIEDIEEGYYDEWTETWVDVSIPYVETIDIVTSTTLQILKFSEPVTITFPTDLNTYVIPEQGPSVIN